MERAANLRASVGLPSKVGSRRSQVVLVHGQGIGGLKPTECAQVVKLVVSAGHFELLARGVEVACITLEKQGRETGGAVRSGEADDAACRICTIEVGVGTAIDFCAFDGSGGERAEIETPAQVAGADTVDEDLVGI